MEQRLDFLREKANKLSLSSGVYLMKDNKGKIIYIGKAKALKNRVTTYFHQSGPSDLKTQKLVKQIHDFDFIVTHSELDALVLECSLIKQNSPKYNILLKDDKGYNYIKITKEEFPRITYALNTADKQATYLGPYTSGFTVRQAVEDANKIFMLPNCNRKFPQDFGKERPCLNYYIKRCTGVCRGDISAEKYNSQVQSALDYIKSGSKKSVNRLTQEMEQAAENLDFELAARLRDQIRSITKLSEGQKINTAKTTKYDIIGFAQNSGVVSVAVIMYRGGVLVDKENFFIGEDYNSSQMREDFILEYYANKGDIPREVYIDEPPDDIPLLQEFFEKSFNRKVKIIVPKRGEGVTQIALAKNNALEYLAVKTGRTPREIKALEDLRELLALEKIPTRIECYDISNIGNDAMVGGMVVYENGRPLKSAYRKFAIKEISYQNDYASMEEMVRRRFLRYLDGDKGFSPLADLILVDGGKGHVNAVSQVAEEVGIDVPIFGLVKDAKHRTRAIAKQGGEIQISANKNLFGFLTGIQDEVHRYTISFQRQKHKKKAYQLELTKVSGIGEKKAAALIKAFKTKVALKNATVEELAKTAKINLEKGQVLYDFIQENL